MLSERPLFLITGIINACLIAALILTKIKSQSRDPEMQAGKKGNQCFSSANSKLASTTRSGWYISSKSPQGMSATLPKPRLYCMARNSL